MQLTSRPLLALAACLIAATACTDDAASPPGSVEPGVAAIAASYDLAAGDPTRFLVGLTGPDLESVAYGSVDLAFRPPDADSASTADGTPPTSARFLPLPGQTSDADRPGPALVSASEALGVYATEPVVFDQAGYWEATVTGEFDGTPFETTAAFQVLPRHEVPAVGDPAPRTDNPILGDPGLDLAALDSRAGPDQPVPDRILHRTRIIDALDAGRPLVVVVSTPTFCQSRFCGPITDAVAGLASDYEDRAGFVHLEVWADFVERTLNPAAAEWIETSGQSEGREPWVFVIDRTGTIRYRFDNVAGDRELRRAVEHVIGP